VSEVDLPPQLMFEQQVCYSLYSAANAMVRAYRPLLETLGVTYLQYMVLMLLWQHSQLQVNELGKQLRLDSGTLTPLLKRLEKKGLVRRSRGQLDERVRIISITELGRELQQQAVGIPGQLAAVIGHSPQQGREFKSLCEQLLGVLEHHK